MGHGTNKEVLVHTQKNHQSIETVPEDTQLLYLIDKI